MKVSRIAPAEPPGPKSVEPDNIPHLSAEAFGRFAKFITHELGIKMPDSKLSMVRSRLGRRVRELRLDSLDSYADYLFHSPDAQAERTEFIDAITTNKTDFFREPQHYDYLTGTVLPEIARSPRGVAEHFRAWSAGCSSGEEAYSLAILLSEYRTRAPGFDFSILATDVSTRILAQARKGIYDESHIGPIAANLRRKYLLRGRKGDHMRVRMVPALRQRVSFHRLNFMDPDYRVHDTFDVIFFRNVMIYFDRKTQESVIQKLCRSLAPEGYLFTGHSETLAGLDVPVTPVQAAVYRKRS
jgi:chemotaxis protein methyltransferase CheR